MTVTSCKETADAKTVLVIDDEEMVLRSAKRMLSRLDCCCLVASTGEDALTVFNTHKDSIDVVLLDMGLPGMDGADVLVRLKEADENVKVVIATGNVHGKEVDELLARGARSYLGKPYSLNDLKETVESL